MILPKTIQDGQAVALWKTNGTREIIEGPKTIFVPFAKMQPLLHAVAREEEYLEVLYKDGSTENRMGPCEMWIDPLKHERVVTKQATSLDAHEALVIYNEEAGEVTHRVLKGPAIYIPAPTEWLHAFRWHGDNGKGQKVPRKLNFQKLRVIPDQMYFDVGSVRTGDEALITVQLMVFFELVDIEKMLKQTHDPIADFINALSADVIRFAGGCDFEAFKTQAKELNNLDTYQELCRGADQMGYQINKVVYRGYVANQRLQEMHDEAIELRTRLVLEAETEEQQQELIDLKLEREHERAEQIREEEERHLKHDLEQQGKERHERLETRRQEEELELTLIKERHRSERDQQRELLELRFQEWEKLANSGGDLTAILVAKEKNPDKTIRLEQEGTNPVHLHEAV